MSKEFCVRYKNKAINATEGTTLIEALKPFVDKRSLCAVLHNGKLLGLDTEIVEDMEIEPVDFSSAEGRDIYRHTSAHIMAQAVKAVFPDAKLAIGPSIENGFYYDFDYHHPFTPADMEQIEQKMKEIIKADLPITRLEMSHAEADKFFKEQNENFKCELIAGLDADEVVSLYSQGSFTDLCKGPHLASTGCLKAFKLLSLAGAYWKGDESLPMLQRIYGTSFPSKKELASHLDHLEEVKKRDHRKLGKDLDLFSIKDDVGPGLILWHPRAAYIRHKIEEFWKEKHLASGYDLLYSPHIARLDLWKKSGHVDFYKENMFPSIEVDNCEYQLKPMNCPFHIEIYKNRKRSYRELPIRWAELGTVYRYERSGVLHGLMRVRGFTQDDAHIFCTVEQMENEIGDVLDLTQFFLSSFGFKEYEVYLSTRPDKYVGSLENWEIATNALKNALEEKDFKYKIDPGEGVFYGPKIDIKIKDSIGRFWQCSTVQVDFNLPDRFNLSYVGSDGRLEQPIMIHRALLGSIERFFGILTEHYRGAYPVWLSSVQVQLLPITDDQHEYASTLNKKLRDAGILSKIDSRSEKIGMKIRDAQLIKIPYMLILGKKEVEASTISVRKRTGDISYGVKIDEFIADIQVEVAEKKQ